MRKLLNKPWFVATLALGAVAFVAFSLLSGRESSSHGRAGAAGIAPVNAENQEAAESDVGPDHGTLRSALKEISNSGLSRNPFLARVKPVAVVAGEKVQQPDEVDSINVGAVWIQSGNAYVLANGRILREGDQLGRIRIETVNRDGVWLRHWKGRDFVVVGSAFTLTTSAKQAAALLGSTEG